MRSGKRKILILMVLLIVLSGFPKIKVNAAKQILLLDAAKELALQHSTDYRQLKSEIALARIQYTETVKSVALQKKDQLAFRWSPLLNFRNNRICSRSLSGSINRCRRRIR